MDAINQLIEERKRKLEAWIWVCKRKEKAEQDLREVEERLRAQRSKESKTEK